jgi:hypothetical protein
MGAGAFVLMQLVFFALLVAGAAVPDGPIVDQLAKDVKAKTYGPNYLRDRMGGSSDSFTECVVVGSGLGGTKDMSALHKAGTMPRLSNCKVGAEQVIALSEGRWPDELNKNAFYFRYWAGYTPLTRPVLALFGMTGLRIIVGGLLFLSLYAAGRAVSRQLGGLAAVGLLGPFVLATNVSSTPSTSFSQSLSIAAYLFGLALCAWAAGRSLTWGLAAVPLAAGIFCYVDLLTTPAIGWALSSTVVAAVTWVRTQRLATTLLALAAAGLLWPLSFAATWISRWVLAIPFAGWDTVVESVKTTVMFRTTGAYRGVRDELWAATSKNWTYWQEHVATSQAVLWLGLAGAVAGLVLAFRRGLAHGAAAFLLAVPALTVPFWYEALRNHSQIHAIFAYRGIPVALGVVLFATLVAARAPRPGERPVEVAAAPRRSEAEVAGVPRRSEAEAAAVR